MAKIREELILYDKFTNTFTKYISLATQAGGASNKVSEAAKSASRSVDRFAKSAKSSESAVSGLTGKLKSLFGAYLSFQGVKNLLSLSDQMTGTTARLNMIVDDGGSVDELQQKIMDSANRSRAAYLTTADAVAKMGVMAGDAFSSNDELIQFTETLNKQFAIAGTSATGIEAATMQLTQAMASGVLRGEELNSVFENAPNVIQTIADYLDVPIGKIREMASEGQITAEIVKNAMLSASDEIDEQFQNMPKTWAQVWNQAQNILIQAFQPMLEIVGVLANVVSENLGLIISVIFGLAAALAIYTVAQWIATGAAKAFFTTLLTNPLTYILLVVGLIVAAIYQWIQSVGGLEIAWLIVVDAVLFAWDTLKAGFMTGVYWVMDLWDNLGLKFKTVGTKIANFMGDMKVNVLTILQNMVNGAIDIINWFIDKLNMIPGVSIEAIEKQTFAATAAAENEAKKQAREEELRAAQEEVAARIAERENDLANMWADRDKNHADRQAEIMQKQKEAAEEAAKTSGGLGSEEQSNNPETENIADDVSAIRKSVSMSEEDLKSLVDMAERQYVNNINLTAQTPVINISGQNTGNADMDRRALANTIRDVLLEQAASASIRTTARVF